MTERRLTLSFDNGPTPTTEPVLEVLRAHDVRASFFVCGANVATAEGAALTAQAKRDGHWIGNHTYSHDVELGRVDADLDVCEAEIGRTQDLLGDLSEPERWFRPSGGGGNLGPDLLSRAAVDYLSANRYSLVLWNSIPRDWEDPDGWPDRALAQIEQQPWTLTVLHDVGTGAMDRLAEFLERVLRDGVEVVQQFPPSCVPILRGEHVLPLDGLVAPG